MVWWLGEKVPAELPDLYKPVIADLHTWEEVSKMYDWELRMANKIVDEMNRQAKK